MHSKTAAGEQILSGKKIVVCSAFFESGMPSLREYQYSRALAEHGASVTLLTSTGSNVWKHNRAGIKPTDPSAHDKAFEREFGVRVVRQKPILRLSDFFVIIPPVSIIRDADLVQVIEFRQGFTVLVAALARLFSKPVIYDHEQRGDRTYSLLHKLDSVFRNILIATGSLFPTALRHTVIANRDNYFKHALKKVSATLAPLGADETLFFYDQALRSAARERLGLSCDEKVAMFSGKLSSIKKVVEVVRAARRCGLRLILVGRIDSEVENDLKRENCDHVIFLGWQPTSALNELYNAADVAIFTNFSVSYWEAASTGVNVLVARTRFSELFSHKEQFKLFGQMGQFVIEEELFKPDAPVEDDIVLALNEIRLDRKRETDREFSWTGRREAYARFVTQFV